MAHHSKYYFYLKHLILLSVLWVGCAPPGGNSNLNQQSACVSNYTGRGLSLKATLLGGTTYSFTLCSDSAIQGAVFTIYGAATAAGVTDPAILTRYRLSHVGDIQKQGQSFQVTFASDLWFVIYTDVESGGSFQYDNTTEMVRGDLSLANTAE